MTKRFVNLEQIFLRRVEQVREGVEFKYKFAADGNQVNGEGSTQTRVTIGSILSIAIPSTVLKETVASDII